MEPGSTIGVGMRGAGQVAGRHLAAVLANPALRLAAVCSRTRSRAEALASEWKAAAKGGEVRVYDHYEELLDDPGVGIVSECMPNHLHAREAVLALRAGKHLILEKPAGMHREELGELREAARISGTRSVVSFVLRWHPLAVNIRNLLDRGAIGRTYYSQFDYWHGIKPSFPSYQWIRRKEFAGGAMITGGCHAVDLARYLHGEIAEVFAFSARGREDFDYPTTFTASVRYADGSLGKVSVSLDGLSFPYQFNIDLLGTGGAIRNNRLYSTVLFPRQEEFALLPCATPDSGSVDHHPFRQEIDNLVEAIQGGTPVLSDVEDACRTMEVCFAIVKSSETGKPERVEQA